MVLNEFVHTKLKIYELIMMKKKMERDEFKNMLSHNDFNPFHHGIHDVDTVRFLLQLGFNPYQKSAEGAETFEERLEEIPEIYREEIQKLVYQYQKDQLFTSISYQKQQFEN